MGFGAGASRAERKAKKRKLENSIPDIPNDLEPESNNEIAPSTKRRRTSDEDINDGRIKDISKNRDTEREREDKESTHTSKKSKTNSTDTLSLSIQIGESSSIAETEAGPKKTKKERKAERKAKEAATKTIPTTQGEETSSNQNEGDTSLAPRHGQKNVGKENPKSEKQESATSANSKNRPARFIVFIGNLPFTATTTSIQKHFAAVKPASVRHLTEKGNPSKSKGCAFLEFEGYDHMKTCLKQFHHSMFNDGISTPRKVNVELTAGGGGNTKDRRSKIQGKNQKLNEQRVRQAQEADNPKTSKSKASELQHVLAEDSGVHPSRKARIGG